MAAQRQQKSWLAGQLKRQLGLQASTEDGELENGDGGGESKPQPMDEDDTAAYNYYPRYNKKVRLQFFSACCWISNSRISILVCLLGGCQGECAP